MHLYNKAPTHRPGFRWLLSCAKHKKCYRKFMEVLNLQAQALADIESLRASGAGEVLAIIPAYVGPWAVSALDAAKFLATNPGEQALFVYDRDSARDRFTRYVAPIVGSVTVANSQTVAKGGHADYAYVASTEDSWERIWGALDPQFAIRHSQTPIAGADAEHVITVPTYLEAGGRRLRWGDADSIR
ncbi:MAG TPA: hypothetical protein VFT58_06400, partial [Nitrososphaera sp.]|nr:hypothetical protein [Nitrososphaera sp.]